MVCANCGKETKGIKLNGKLYCNFCGEIIKDSTEILEERYQETSQKVTHEQVGEDNFIENKLIAKHQRPRVDHNHYGLVSGEPDPIAVPELESPHDDQIDDGQEIKEEAPDKKESDENESKLTYSFMPKAERDKIKASEKQKQDVFTSFIKETSKAISAKDGPKKNKKPNKRHHRILWAIATTCVSIILILVGLVLYVNLVVNNEARIQNDLKKNASFSYSQPNNAPAGYKLSYLSEAGDNYIFYYYVFTGNKNRFISLKIEKTTLKSEDILKNFLGGSSTSYSMKKIKDLDFWKTSNNIIYVIKDSVLYTFSGSTNVDANILTSFAEETLF